ncbi:MAG TPA: bacteriohemerythrin [Bryobacteraceae bacterium]
MQQEVLRARQPFEWREEWSVGIPELDAQHRHLIELLGELVRCTQSGEGGGFAPTALREMNRYADWHLQREELVLRIRGYPGYTEHKAEHDAYRKKAASLQVHSERRDFGFRIANFLTRWWRFHIRISDQRYARFFRGRPSNA